MRPFRLRPMEAPTQSPTTSAPRVTSLMAASTSTKATTSWPQGTPILAPFDGGVRLPQLARRARGLRPRRFGYVYNAHLSRLGTLGPVEAGDVIGYVGSTGHSSGPHNHLSGIRKTEDPPSTPTSTYCGSPFRLGASHGDLRPDFAVA